MNPQAILANIQNNRQMQIVIGVVVLGVILLVGFMAFRGSGGGDAKANADNQKLTKEQTTLAQVTSLGQALEIQALLAKHGIRLTQVAGDGGKTDLKFMDDATEKDRDMAIITLVQSGLMDKNVGLESFDKGDLTASREEKRIKLIRAQQGELARLIRKIEPIEDASVNIAIPEQTLFRSEEKPLTASVQVTLPVGARLSRDKVRAITNLMVGSLQGLDSGHVSISDTNGTTYNSVLDPGSDMDDKLEDQDNYMKQKVAAQLDRLVGTGNYVVTVSTELRQAPKETMVQEFDPQGGVVSSKQSFNENMNTHGAGPGAGGPASSFLPNSLSTMVAGGNAGKDYLRNGVEVSYNNSKTQWMESRPVGMIEDISIAVTIDANHFPAEMSVNELQRLLASAASPQVRPENVSIARSEIQKTLPINHSEGPAELPQDLSWLYWAGGAVAFCILMILLLSSQKGSKGTDQNFMQAQQEIQQLREFTSHQQAQLQATQQQTQMLLEAQQRQMQQAQELQSSVTETQKRLPQTGGIQQTLEELREAVASDDIEEDNLDLQIKSWIESS